MCPLPSFFEVSDTCYRVSDTGSLNMHFQGAWSLCLVPRQRKASAVLLAISSQQQQHEVEKIISSSSARNVNKVWTALKAKKKTFANGTVAWLDDDNRPLTYTNFADNQNPVGVACVVLSKKHNYKWITVDCSARSGVAAICVADKGR